MTILLNFHHHPDPLILKRQLPKANPREILAPKFSQTPRNAHQIHKGYASLFVRSFASSHFLGFRKVNCRAAAGQSRQGVNATPS